MKGPSTHISNTTKPVTHLLSSWSLRNSTNTTQTAVMTEVIDLTTDDELKQSGKPEESSSNVQLNMTVQIGLAGRVSMTQLRLPENSIQPASENGKSKKRKADETEPSSQERPSSSNFSVKLAGQIGWLDHAIEESATKGKCVSCLFRVSANLSIESLAELAQRIARYLVYYRYHSIQVAKVDLVVCAIGEISSHIQRNHDQVVKGGTRTQNRIITEQVLPRAQQIIEDARNQKPPINLETLSGAERRAHLAKIFEKDKLWEVENMWLPFTGTINFKAMYDVPDSASAEIKDLMKKWRIYNRECWLRAIDNEIRLRCKSGASRKDKTLVFKMWRGMVSASTFAPFLPPDVSKVPMVCDESFGKRRKIEEKEYGHLVGLQTGTEVDLENV
jgi:hypothetical protein